MKEISIEEKAKRYDEAVRKATALYKVAEPMSGCNVIIETLFPELKKTKGTIIVKDNKCDGCCYKSKGCDSIDQIRVGCF